MAECSTCSEGLARVPLPPCGGGWQRRPSSVTLRMLRASFGGSRVKHLSAAPWSTNWPTWIFDMRRGYGAATQFTVPPLFSEPRVPPFLVRCPRSPTTTDEIAPVTSIRSNSVPREGCSSVKRTAILTRLRVLRHENIEHGGAECGYRVHR